MYSVQRPCGGLLLQECLQTDVVSTRPLVGPHRLGNRLHLQGFLDGVNALCVFGWTGVSNPSVLVSE